MYKTTITAMITGIGGGGHGEQILKALRLSSLPLRIVGADMSPISKGLSNVDAAYLLPSATDARYIDSVIAVCKQESVDILFHGSEPELKAMSQHRDHLKREGVLLPINPRDVIDTCMDKSKTMKALEAAGTRVPRWSQISTTTEMREINFLPAVLKPSIGGGGSANTFIAQTPEELLMFGNYLLNLYPAFIAQEYVGTPNDEYTVGVLLSLDGELLNSIAVKRHIMSSLSNRLKVPNLTGRKDLGDTLVISSGISQGNIGHYPTVTKQCEKIALTMGCCSAVNIQCRLVDQHVYVFEINPRFSGTTSLRALVGYNEPEVLIRKHLLGEDITYGEPYHSGIIMRGLEETLVENHAITQAVELL